MSKSNTPENTTIGHPSLGPPTRRPTFIECRDKALRDLRVAINEAERLIAILESAPADNIEFFTERRNRPL